MCTSLRRQIPPRRTLLSSSNIALPAETPAQPTETEIARPSPSATQHTSFSHLMRRLPTSNEIECLVSQNSSFTSSHDQWGVAWPVWRAR